MGGPCTSGDNIVAIAVQSNTQDLGAENTDTSNLLTSNANLETPSLTSADISNAQAPSGSSRPAGSLQADDLSANTSNGTSVTITFSATGSGDLKGEIVDGPQHGKLGSIDQQAGTVEYKPEKDFVGTDTFSYL